MSERSSEDLPWWDREFDPSGTSIRADVRASARELWSNACRQTKALLGEACEAYRLMERAVIQISRYLDRQAIPLFSRDTDRLLMCAFGRALRRLASKRRRMVLPGDAEIDAMLATRRLAIDQDRMLDAERAASHFSDRARRMYDFREAGYEWKEIAPIFGTTEAAARAEYSRELKKARRKLGKTCGFGEARLGTDSKPKEADKNRPNK
jgi:hypothetical protein